MDGEDAREELGALHATTRLVVGRVSSLVP